MKTFLMTVQVEVPTMNPMLVTHIVEGEDYHEAFARIIFAISPTVISFTPAVINVATLDVPQIAFPYARFIRLKQNELNEDEADFLDGPIIRINTYDVKGIQQLAESIRLSDK